MDKTAASACISAAVDNAAASAGTADPADPLDWNDIRYALAILRGGSLAAAARTLGVDQTTVARRLRALEAGIGAPLFERHRGTLTPTFAGTLVLQRGTRIEREVAALRHLAADHQAQVRGAVRLTAVDAIVSYYLVRHLADLRARHPGLAVELIASSRTLDLARREADLAIRLARPESGDFIVRRLADLGYGVYGPRTAPTETGWQACDWVAYERSLAHVPEMRWLAGQADEERITFRCNNMEALASAVADGFGLGILPHVVGTRHATLRCLSGTTPVLSREIWLVVPRELRDVPRIRAVCDWLVERFAADATRFASGDGDPGQPVL